MASLTVNGRSVTVDDSFLKLSPEEQNSTVDEIAKSLPAEKPSGVIAGLKEGLAGMIHGPAETLKTFAGLDTSGMEDASKKVAPTNYKSAPIVGPEGHWYDPTSYNWKNVPQALAENAPQMAETIAAAKIGAKIHPAVGLAAGAGTFALNALGDTAKTAAVKRTGDENAEPNTEDKTRAGLTVAAQAVPQVLGVSRFLPGANKITQVGVDGAVRAAGKAAVTTGIEGATGAAQDAIGQAGQTLGTPGGLDINGNQVANAAVTNAVTGGAFALPKMAADAASARRYAKFGGDNAKATEDFANRIKDAADGANLGNTKNGFNAVRQAHEDTIAELKNAAKLAGPTSPETAAAIKRATKGRELTDADHAELEANSTPDVAALARQAHVGAMLKGEGDFEGGRFTGGVTNAISKHIRAYANPIGAGASAALGAATGGGHAASLFAYSPETLAALTTAYGAMRGVDALTGNRSPANKFVNKFGTDNPITPTLGVPQPPQAPQAPQPAAPNNTLPAGPWGLKPPMLRPTGPQVAPPSLTPPPAAPQLPWSAPKIGELWNGPNAIAQKMLAQKLKAGLPEEPPAPAPAAPKLPWNPPQIGELWNGPNAVAAKMLKEKLKAGLPPEPAAPADESAIPSFLPDRIPAFLPKRDAPAAPVAEPTSDISDLIARMKARYPTPPPAPEKITKKKGGPVKAAVAETPAPEEPVVDNTAPYPSKVTDRAAPRDFTKRDTTKLTPHEAANSAYDLTNDYVPLQARELHGKDMTHDEFAAKETADKLGSGELEQDKAAAYHDAVVRDRIKRERTLQELSQSSVTPSDTPALQALLEQLHHIRRGETARAAIYHYTSMMSSALRAKVLRRLDSSFVNTMWSKEN